MASKARQLIQELQLLKANPTPTGVAFDPNYRTLGQTGKYSALMKPSKVSFHVLRQLSRANAIVRLCIDTLKHRVARQSWAFMPIDEDADPAAYQTQIDYATNLLKRPNPNNETFRTLIEKTVEDLLALDQADWELIRSGDGVIREIYPIDGATIRPVYDKFGQYLDPAYLQYLPANYDVSHPDAQFGMNELIHMMQNPQTDTWYFGYGLSPIEGIILAATNFLNADIYQGEVFTKGNLSQIMISLGKNANQAQVKQFREFLITQMQGQNYSVPVIGGSENPEVLKLAPSQKDAQYMEYVQWEAKVIVGAFGLSPQDIGLNLDQYKAEGEVQAELSDRKGFASLLDLLQEYINQELLWEGLADTDPAFKEIQFVWTDLEQVNEKERADIAKIEVELGATTINEYRLTKGLEPINGGDRAFILTRQGPVYLDSIDQLQAQMQQQAVTQNQPDQSQQINQPSGELGTDETTKKSLTAKTPPSDLAVAFIDKDQVPHAFGKEVSFIGSGDRVPREAYQAAKAKFYEAAQLSYGYLNPRDIQKQLGLTPVEITGNLKEAQTRITNRLETDADAIYGVVTHFQKFGAETQPLYGVYYLSKSSLGLDESYDFQKASYVQPLDRLIDQYSALLNTKIKKFYPRLKAMIPTTTKAMDDLSERADDYDPATDEAFLVEPDQASKAYYEDAIALALALGAQNLISKAKTGKQRERIAQVVDRFTPKSLESFVDDRNLEAAKSVAMTLKDGATKLISGMAEEGKSTDEITAALKDFLGFEDGWRAKRIARTELNFAAARASQEQAAKVGAAQKSWLKHTNSPEDECNQNQDAGWIGLEESYPSGAMSPADSHVNCILPGQEIETTDVTAKIIAEYDGEVIELAFASGKTITTTPNHLVATPSGWMKASELHHGSDVLSAPNGIKGIVSSVHPDVEPVKSLIEQVSIPNGVISRSVPTSSVDLHGDGVFTQNVDIVLPNGVLLDGANTHVCERSEQVVLGDGSIEQNCLTCPSPTYEGILGMLHAAHGTKGMSSNGSPLLEGHATPGKPSGLTDAAKADALLLEQFSQESTAKSETMGEFQQRFAGLVSLDQVTEVTSKRYTGHVYDLSTGVHFYTTNSIITHNCSCSEEYKFANE